MNIDLSAIQQRDLLGEWKVIDRYVNKSLLNPFNETKVLDLKENFYQSVNGQIINGNWTIEYEKEIIYNPQLKFFSGVTKINEAIITRLYIEEKQMRMFLYFSTGMELILSKYV